MSPTVLSSYLRVVMIYGIGVAVAVGAGYELIKYSDWSNPLVTFAGMYLSTLLGMHVSLVGGSAAVANASPATDTTVVTGPSPMVAAPSEPVIAPVQAP